jgi:type I restriction enzyme M protein
MRISGEGDFGRIMRLELLGQQPIFPSRKAVRYADFNDANKLGSGKDMVDRLTNLIAIFENKALDFGVCVERHTAGGIHWRTT